MENQFIASGTCGVQGDNLIWTLTPGGVLTISGKGNIDGDADENALWNSHSEAIQTVVLQRGVTGIGEYAFIRCRNMTSIVIPGSVTSIESWAFSNCRSLNSIEVAADNPCFSSLDGVLFNKDRTELLRYPRNKPEATYSIPNGVKGIRNCAFLGCASLTSITISKDVKNMPASWFVKCKNLTAIEVVADNPCFSSQDGVLFNKDRTELLRYPKNKAGAAYNIPDGVEYVGLIAFDACHALTVIAIPASVTDLDGWAFSNCDNLTAIEVAADNLCYSSQDGVLFNKERTKLLRYPVNKAGAVYNIPDGVEYIGRRAFGVCNDCSALVCVIIPDSVECIDRDAFFGCKALAELTVRAVEPPAIDVEPAVIVAERTAFSDVDKSIPVYVPAESIEAYRTAEGWNVFSNFLPIEKQRKAER